MRKVHHIPQLGLTMLGDDLVTSICPNCNYMPGAWLPGVKCPECGEPML